MIGAVVGRLAGSACARGALRYGVTVLANLLLLLALRRSGERAGRLAATKCRFETVKLAKERGVSVALTAAT